MILDRGVHRDHVIARGYRGLSKTLPNLGVSTDRQNLATGLSTRCPKQPQRLRLPEPHHPPLIHRMKLSRIPIILALSIGTLGWTSPVHAFDFVEQADFPITIGSPFDIPFNLEIGVNSIHGTLPPTIGGNFEFSDTDVFRVANPDGFAISLITLDITNYQFSGSGSGRLELLQPNVGAVRIRSNGTSTLPTLISDPSVLAFRIAAPLEFYEGPDGRPTSVAGSANYTVEITVVPEPATYGILGLALGIIAFLRRRKRLIQHLIR